MTKTSGKAIFACSVQHCGERWERPGSFIEGGRPVVFPTDAGPERRTSYIELEVEDVQCPRCRRSGERGGRMIYWEDSKELHEFYQPRRVQLEVQHHFSKARYIRFFGEGVIRQEEEKAPSEEFDSQIVRVSRGGSVLYFAIKNSYLNHILEVEDKAKETKSTVICAEPGKVVSVGTWARDQILYRGLGLPAEELHKHGINIDNFSGKFVNWDDIFPF